MAPTRKPRTMNKWPSSLNEVSPEKGGANLNTNKQRKKNLSDKLRPQWNKAELERFYEAYRKYGTDWKKVAAVVRNRSVEMVEALYNMNRAYLSLPEGTASVVGLIAMMTDHYNVLEMEEDDSYEEYVPVAKRRAIEAQKILQRKGKAAVVTDADLEKQIVVESKPSLLEKASQLKREQPEITVTEQIVQQEKEMIVIEAEIAKILKENEDDRNGYGV